MSRCKSLTQKTTAARPFLGVSRGSAAEPWTLAVAQRGKPQLWRTLLACRIETRLDAFGGAHDKSRHECRLGRHECLRHVPRQNLSAPQRKGDRPPHAFRNHRLKPVPPVDLFQQALTK